MTELEYKKFIAPNDRDFDSKAVLLRTAIENAKKRDGKLTGYRKLRKFQLIRAVRRQAV